MLKKLTCLVLCLMMMVPVLASCQKDGDISSETAEEASRYTTTLNMWVVTEEGTDPAQATAVNEAINKITKQKFKTQLNIKFLTEAEYYGKIEQAYADKKEADRLAKEAREAAKKAAEEAAKRGETVATTAETVQSEETFLDEYGIPQLKYPTVPDYQVDILFIGSFEKYREYVDKEWLTSMDGSIDDVAGQLSYYIHSIFQEAAVYDGLLYAMPNNHVIGDYTFLVADTQLLQNYHYTAADFANSSIYDKNCYNFLKYAYNDGITPIYSESGKLDLGLVHYWNFDLDSVPGSAVQNSSTFSLYGGIFADSAKRGDTVPNGLLLRDNEYIRRWKYKTEYETTSGFITTDANEKTAVKIVTGGYELKEKYENEGYTVLMTEAPRATDETIYSSMFAIGSYTADEARAMEIIAYLNTNIEFRNLLQYGIEGINYRWETVPDTDISYIVPTENNAYHMDVAKTGNQFIAYPTSPTGAQEIEYYKTLNRDATTYPTLGLYFSNENVLNTDAIRIVNVASAKIGAYMEENLTDLEKVDAFFSNFATLTSAATRAEYLMTIVGEGVQYNAEGAVITASNLASAMAVMAVTTYNENSETHGPYELYQYWLANSGVVKKTTGTTNQ